MIAVDVARWVGADAGRVGLIVRAIESDAKGRHLNFEATETSSFNLEPGFLHTMLVLGAALLSALVAGLFLAAPRGAEELGIVAAVFCLLFALAGALTHAAHLLLADDDAPVVGHWPVTARDVGAARLWLLIRRTLQIGLAGAVAPSLVVAFWGSPMIVGGIVVFGAALLSSLLAALTMALVFFGLRRTIGRRRTQRLSSVVTIGLMLVPGFLAAADAAGPQGMPAWLPWVAWLPPMTFVSWPVLLHVPIPQALFVAALGLVVLGGVGALAVRLVARGGSAERVEAESSREILGSSWLEVLLLPWMPGRDALVARRLLIAHLRSDWTTLLRASIVPLQLLIILFGPFLRDGPLSLVADGDGMRWFHFVIVLMAGLGANSVMAGVRSTLRGASWVVAASPAATWRWAAWQRGAARAFGLPVIVPAVLVLHVLAGTSPWRVIDDLLLVVLAHEAGIRVGQWIQWRAPHSVPPDFTDGKIVGAVFVSTITVLPASLAWLVFVHARFVWAVPVTYAILAAVLWASWRKTTGRRMEFV